MATRVSAVIATFGPIVIALASAVFAGFAWWTTKQELRLNLYNKRFEVYSRTLDMFHAIEGWEPTPAEKSATSLEDSSGFFETQKAFIKASREAGFLFGKNSDAQKLLVQMSADVIGIIGYKRDTLPRIGGEREMGTKAYNDFLERLGRIHSTIPKLENALRPYLDFHSIGRRRLW